MGLEDTNNLRDWDKRLTEQYKRGWDNYVHRRIDLSVARIDEVFNIPGEFIYVEDRSSVLALAKIKFQKNIKDALDLEKGVEIHTVFTQVFISNDALQGEWLDLIFGINFVYKKKIAIDEIDAVLNFLTGGPIATPAGINLNIIPGAGGITQIGDAGVTSRGLVANDDLFVSGKLEVDGSAYFDGVAYFQGIALSGAICLYTSWGSWLDQQWSTEEITIPVGQGAAGVISAGILAPARTTIIACHCRVTQAPGGGATTIDIGRTGGNLDEFIDGIGTALGTRGTFAGNHDAATVGPVFNVAANTLTLTTDFNVAISDMKVKVLLVYQEHSAPTW